MLAVFFASEGSVLSQILLQDQMVNAQYYLNVLKSLRENIRQKIPELWKDNSWFLYHDNA